MVFFAESRNIMALEQIIKYEGDNSTFVWKHPCEDFNTGSQLIVHESQEAVFFLNGQALDVFGPGRYTLETENIPLLRKFVNIPTGGISPFHCEVYFVNKTEQMAIRWGTDSKVQYIEPTYGFPLAIGANGEMTLAAADPRDLLTNLVGTESILDRQHLANYFRAFLMTRIKTYLAQAMRNNSVSIFEIDERLEEFSKGIHDKLKHDFAGYGIDLRKFFVTGIVKPDGNEQYEKFKELHFRQYADVAEAKLKQQVGIIEQQTAAQRMVIESKAIAAKRQQEGYTYQQERGFDVAEQVAQNEAIGQFTNMGVGLGTMAGVGGAVGGVLGTAINSAVSGIDSKTYDPPTASVKCFCDNCGAELDVSALFCDKCGTKQENRPLDKCPKCGFEFTRPGKFCPKCGYNREGQQ